MLFILLVTTADTSLAQQTKVKISGMVYESGSKRPLAGVIISQTGSAPIASTDDRGFFKLTQQPKGRIQLSLALLGHQPKVLELELNKDTLLSIALEVQSLALSEVSIVSKQKKLGSSNVIDQTAIKHLQATSLGDVLQLLPGQLATSFSMSAAQQINLRQAATNGDAARNNALGTAVILDGIPLSNNANMQTNVTILNSSPGSLAPFSSVAGRGNDLRQISADQIESVEVITGVPSARYGDLTSGGIMVNTRAGVFKPQFTTRINPLMVQQAVGLGLKLGSNMGILSLDNDILHANDDPRNTQSQYTRLGTQLTWSKQFLKNKQLFTTTRLALYSTLDNQKQDPDDQRYQRRIYSRDQSLRLGTNLKFNAGLSWLSTLTADFGFSYAKQNSYVQELITRDLFPVTDRLLAGRHIARYGESEYLSAVSVNGKPISLYNRVEGTLLKIIDSKKISHRLIAGWEYRLEGNNGNGRQFDSSRPPRQNYAAGDRPRSYSSIPKLQQLAYYAEDLLTMELMDREIQLSTGLRYDLLQPTHPFNGKLGGMLLPRINLAVQTFDALRLKAGYGTAAKSPTLSYLYPGNRYIDLVNFNYYAPNPAERLVVMTTHVFNTDNESLRPYRSQKFEVGLDYQKHGFSGYITAYKEAVKGAFGTNREVQVLMVERLSAEQFPSGAPPILSEVPAQIVPFYAGYDKSVNNRRITNEGIEFQISTPKIASLNTSFIANGAWIETTSFDDGAAVDYQKAVFSSTTPERVAIYQSGFGNKGRRFNTSLRFMTHFPQLKFLLSGLAQTIWTNTNRSLQLDELPMGYVDKTGAVTYLTPQQAASEQYADLRRRLSSTLAAADTAPPLWYFSVKLTKQFKNNSGLSFYIDNVIADRGTYLNTVSNTYIKRNHNLFFGAEFSIQL
jgi:hypothetical protein